MKQYLPFLRNYITQRTKIFIASIVFVLVFIFLFGGVFLFVNSYEWQGQKREILNESIESVKTWKDAEQLFGDYRLVEKDGRILINRGVFEFLPSNIEDYEELIELEGMHFFIISKTLFDGTKIYFVDDITDAIELRGITNKSLFLSGGILIIFVGICAWYFTEKIFQPIRLLIRSMELFSLDAGPDSDKVSIHGADSDEFVMLARNLESLYSRIRIEGKKREELSNNIAHELKNGLFEIGSTLEIAEIGLKKEKMGELPKNGRKSGIERVIEARNEVIHLNKLTEGLLLLGNKDKEIIKTSTSLRKIILNNLPIDKESTNFEVHCKEAVYWDISESLFEIVLKNIIGNAVKFNTPNEKIIIHADSEKIQITDKGNGIDPKDLPFVFDVFYTGSSSRTKGSGHGIGLALVKRICEMHGFQVKIISELSHGTTVSILNSPSKHDK